MDASPHQHQHSQARYPPSPPPSPKARRRHKKKLSDDPFFQLGLPASHEPAESPPSSPSTEADIPDDSLYKRIFLTPFLFTSFLLSLFLIDTQNAVSRTRDSGIFGFFDPEPYQDLHHPRWQQRDPTSPAEPQDAGSKYEHSTAKKQKRGSWHLRRNIRKIARLEITDAFEMRRRVMVAMIIVFFVALYAIWCSCRWIWSLF